jgi:thymidylate synthase (FAD)
MARSLDKILESTELVELVSITEAAQNLTSFIARVSNPANQLNFDTSEKLISYCINNGHWSILEHVHATLQINTSRMISPQLLRHRSFCFQEFSQRYAAVDEKTGLVLYAARRQDHKNRQNSIDDIPVEVQKEWEQRQQNNWKQAWEHYVWALDQDIAKECARAVLPLQTATKLYMTGNIRSWFHYIQLRSDAATQKEHRDIAEAARNIFVEQFPTVANLL